MTDYTVPSLSNLTQSTVDQMTEQLVTRLSELATGIDFNRQAAFRQVPYLHGVLLASTVENVMTDLSIMNLDSMAKGELTKEQSDQVAAMFGLERRAGTKNVINVLFSFSSPTPFVISVQDYVYIGSVKFSVLNSVSVRTSRSTVSSSSDLVLYQTGLGRWGVVVPMTARVVGADANVAVGTNLSFSKQLLGLIETKVTKSEGSGTAEESDTQLAERALSENAVQSWAGKNSFEALARSSGNYPTLVAISVVGFGDIEQRRDRRGVLPGSTGGRVDLWTKFRPGLYSANVPVDAVLISKVGAIGTWSFVVGSSANPGIYKVDHVVSAVDQSGTRFYPDAQSLVLAAEDINLVPLEGERYIPDVRNIEEAAFSEYCNMQVTFTDSRYDVTSVNVGATRSYVAFTYYEPKVSELQQYLGSPAIRNAASDVLVKQAIPANLYVSIEVSGVNAANTLDTARNAVVNFVNGKGFVTNISAADIAGVVRGVNTNLTVEITSMTCEIRKIDGSTVTINFDGKKIQLPDLPEELLSWKTIAFYTDQSKVSVTAR